MKPEHHHLLQDLLEANDAAAQRDAILHAGSSVLRRKRQARFIARTLGGLALAALAVLAVGKLMAPRPPSAPTARRVAAAQPTRDASRVQEISDDELLALFPGTPVGLVKINGKQRLIFPRPKDEARFVVNL
jgi:hypothetical protein